VTNDPDARTMPEIMQDIEDILSAREDDQRKLPSLEDIEFLIRREIDTLETRIMRKLAKIEALLK